MKKNTLTNNLENMKTKLITFCVTITIFLYDWGKVIDGRLLAVVSLDMTCICEGKETQIRQSGVYEVSYGIDTEIMQPEDAHYPPQSIVVNYGNPFTNWYGWN